MRTDEQRREKVRECLRKRRTRLRAQGICLNCGKQPSRKGRTCCELCGKRQAIKRVADAYKVDPRAVEFALEYDRGIVYAVNTTEHVLELEAALKELIFVSRDFVSEAYINDARAALQPEGE